MYIVIFCSIICLLLTYQESVGNMKNGMRWGFILVTILGAIHYDYGNDYMSYYQVYLDVEERPFNFKAIMDGDYYREPGWLMLCYLFRNLGGFFTMVATLNALQNWIIFKSIKKYVDKKWWTLSVFTYLFVTSFYLMEFTMMRQFFVMCVFLAMWPFVYNRKWYIPFVVLYLCSYVHSSAIILTPLAFWGYIPIRKHRVIGVVYLVVFFSLWLMDNVVGDAVNYIVSVNETMEDYVNTYEEREGGLTLGLGFVMYMIPIILSVLYLFKHDKNDSDEKISLVIFTSIGYLITPFAFAIPLAGRMGMYFGIYKIITVPYIYDFIPNRACKYLLLGLFLLINSYDYWLFFNNPVWVEKFSEFHTIFEVI